MLDFGCGHGTDVRLLMEQGVNIAGYDAFHKEYDRRPSGSFDLVTLNFVVNVLPREYRDQCLKDAWKCVCKGGTLFVSARPMKDVLRYSSSWDSYEDGWLTSAKTFQTGYSQDALGLYLMDQLGADEVHTGTRPTFVYGWLKKT